jgi:hypothetical protein
VSVGGLFFYLRKLRTEMDKEMVEEEWTDEEKSILDWSSIVATCQMHHVIPIVKWHNKPMYYCLYFELVPTFLCHHPWAHSITFYIVSYQSLFYSIHTARFPWYGW